MFVLIVVFYRLAATRPSSFVTTYEWCTGLARCDHVGLSLGFYSPMQGLQVLAHDVSAWAGRRSGPTPIQAVHADAQTFPNPLAVRAQRAFVFPLEHAQHAQHVFAPFLGMPLAPPPTSEPLDTEERYPSMLTMCGDALWYHTGLVSASEDNLMRLADDVRSGQSKMQCAQLTTLLLVELAAQSPTSILHAEMNQHLYALRCLLRRRSALHPGALWRVLEATFGNNNSASAGLGHVALGPDAGVTLLTPAGPCAVAVQDLVLGQPQSFSPAFSVEVMQVLEQRAV
tara:strand:- start:76 stop:930 length:855 start_codon:yes stop_codon:yes gene_type:complete